MKNEAYVQAVTSKYDTDTDGDGTSDSLRIYGSGTEMYDIKLSDVVGLYRI